MLPCCPAAIAPMILHFATNVVSIVHVECKRVLNAFWNPMRTPVSMQDTFPPHGTLFFCGPALVTNLFVRQQHINRWHATNATSHSSVPMAQVIAIAGILSAPRASSPMNVQLNNLLNQTSWPTNASFESTMAVAVDSVHCANHHLHLVNGPHSVFSPYP